jgi:hypothetical protein
VDDLKRECGKVLCITALVDCREESDGGYQPVAELLKDCGE